MGPTTTAGATRLMEKPGKELLQLQQQALKCPRCDSSNTKFCYYNNYSLTQPRHFCKACKRYWTRGGTLRNLPVGGGCRRNKRVRRAASSISTVDHNGASSSGNNNSIPNPNQINLASSNPNHHHHHHHLNPLFYQPDHHLGINMNPFDQLSSLGLGFGHDQRFDSLHSSNQALFSSTFNSSAPTMASVLASKFINNGFKDVRGNGNQYFQNLLPFEDLQIDHDGGDEAKEVKGEGGQGKMGLSSTSSTNHQGNVEQMGMSSDPTLHWSSSSKLGGNSWHDPASLASSVSSLI